MKQIMALILCLPVVGCVHTAGHRFATIQDLRGTTRTVMEQRLASGVVDIAVDLERELAVPLAVAISPVSTNVAIGSELLSEVANIWPNSPYAGAALAALAQRYEASGEYQQAVDTWIRCVSHLGTNAPVEKIAWRCGYLYHRLADYGRVAQVFEAFTVAHPQSHKATIARLVAGQCYLLSDRPKEALTVLLPFRTGKRKDDKEGLFAEGLYWFGVAHFLLDNKRDAFRSMKILTWDYPGTCWKAKAGAFLDYHHLGEDIVEK